MFLYVLKNGQQIDYVALHNHNNREVAEVATELMDKFGEDVSVLVTPDRYSSPQIIETNMEDSYVSQT